MPGNAKDAELEKKGNQGGKGGYQIKSCSTRLPWWAQTLSWRGRDGDEQHCYLKLIAGGEDCGKAAKHQ